MLQDGGTINAFTHQRQFVLSFDTQEAQVIPPRADSLLSRAVIDLSKSDVRLRLPQIQGNRYYSCAFYDVYGNNFAYTSSLDGESSGLFLLTYHGAAADDTIEFPTAFGFILLRYQLNISDPTEENKVNHLQNRARLSSAQSYEDDGSQTVSLTEVFDFPRSYDNQPEELMRALAAIQSLSPTVVSDDERRVSSLLQIAGIEDGVYTAREDVDLIAMYYVAGNSSVVAYSSGLTSMNGNWWTTPKTNTGDFGADYATRAIQSVFGYGQTTEELEFAPAWSSDGSPALMTMLEVAPGQDVIVRFPVRPPLRRGGFWAMAVYSQDEFAALRLIANPQDIYLVSSMDPLLTDKDREFEILLSVGNSAPPTNWTGNWLPVGGEGGLVVLDCKCL